MLCPECDGYGQDTDGRWCDTCEGGGELEWNEDCDWENEDEI